MPRADLETRVASLESQVADLAKALRGGAKQSTKKNWRLAVEEYAGDADLQGVFADALELRAADRKHVRGPAPARKKRP